MLSRVIFTVTFPRGCRCCHCTDRHPAPSAKDLLQVTQPGSGRAQGLGSWPLEAIPTFGTRPSPRICPCVPVWSWAWDPVSVLVPHYTPGPRSLRGAETGSSLGVTGCPTAVAGELAGRAVTARGAGLKAVGGLQTRGAGTCPALGVTGAAIATAAGLVTLGSPHSRGTVCERRKGKRLSGVSPSSSPPPAYS